VLISEVAHGIGMPHHAAHKAQAIAFALHRINVVLTPAA